MRGLVRTYTLCTPAAKHLLRPVSDQVNGLNHQVTTCDRSPYPQGVRFGDKTRTPPPLELLITAIGKDDVRVPPPPPSPPFGVIRYDGDTAANGDHTLSQSLRCAKFVDVAQVKTHTRTHTAEIWITFHAKPMLHQFCTSLHHVPVLMRCRDP